MAAFEAGLANRTPVSRPGFLRLHWELHPTSLYSGRPHSGMLVVPALLLTRAQSHRLRERKVFSQDGLHTSFLPSFSSSAGRERVVPAGPVVSAVLRCTSLPGILPSPGAGSLVTYLPTNRCQDVESYHWKELLVCDFGPHRFYVSCTVGNDIGAP